MTPHTPIPDWVETPDYFVWEAFDQASADPARHFAADATQQEALLAETDYFYVIPDQFGVVSGHVLILPKESVRSIASLDPQIDSEIDWLIRHVSTLVAGAYSPQVVVAEHGGCGSASMPQAHIHVLPIPATMKRSELCVILDQVLRRRMVGIERIVHDGVEYTELEDLRRLVSVDDAKVIGHQIVSGDLRTSVRYPADARQTISRDRSYVYFAGPGTEFIGTQDFRPQFVREVVSLAYGLPPDAWDRWAHTSRNHMFTTFTRLAPLFGRSRARQYGFRPRWGV